MSNEENFDWVLRKKSPPLNMFDRARIKKNWQGAFTTLGIHVYVGKNIVRMTQFFDEAATVLVAAHQNMRRPASEVSSIVYALELSREIAKRDVATSFPENNRTLFIVGFKALQSLLNTVNLSDVEELHQKYIAYRLKRQLWRSFPLTRYGEKI